MRAGAMWGQEHHRPALPIAPGGERPPLRAALLAILALAGAALAPHPAQAEPEFSAKVLGRFTNPWAVAVLPEGGFLVTEKAGRLVHLTGSGAQRPVEISGGPRVALGEQTGLHDVALAPDFARSGLVYLTWIEGPEGGALHLGRGQLDLAADPPQLRGFTRLWQARPTGGRGHPGAIMAFAPDGSLFLTAGERQQGDPAQDLSDSRGKVLHLTPEGAPAPGNPFPEAPEVWSYGHRNPYGLAFDAQGRLWLHEMGPRGGDELNLIEPGRNYGWPLVSEGDNYTGWPIPDHATRPEFTPPWLSWTPVIAPAGMIAYQGDLFPEWQGALLIGGLRSRALVQVALGDGRATEAARWEFAARIRDVAQDAAGQVYLLEDGAEGQLLRLERE